MIYPELKNYLIQISSSETVDLFDNSIAVFDKYNVPDYMTVFDATIGELNELGADDILSNLLIDLRTILNHLLSIQGVIVTDETSISQLTIIADTLFELPYYSDKVVLNNTMDSDESDIEKFCSLLTLLIPCSVEELLVQIESVNEDFISNFKNQTNEVKEDKISAESIKKHVDAYIKYKDLILNDEPNYADKFFIQTSSIGLPYEDYIKQYQIDRAKDLQDLEIDKIAKELVGLTTLSFDGLDNPLMVTRKHLSDLYSDITTTTKLDIAISKIVLTYTQ